MPIDRMSPRNTNLVTDSGPVGSVDPTTPGDHTPSIGADVTAPSPISGAAQAFRHQIGAARNAVRNIDPARKDATARRARKQVRNDLNRLTKQIKSELRDLNKQIERNPPALGAQAERRALHSLLNDYAEVGAKLGRYGLDVVERLAEVFYDDVLVLEPSPGKFALWNGENKWAPVLVAQLPARQPLDADSFVKEAIPKPPKLGDAPADSQVVKDLPKLGHLADALGSDRVKIAGLFDDGSLDFETAPDPTEMLNRTHATNAAKDIAGGVELKVLSYNVALLEYKLFGFWTHKESPLIAERRDDIAEQVFGGGDDVIMLQEVWRDEDVALFAEEAAKRGYRAFVGPRGAYTDGLVTFVKEEIIDDQSDPSHRVKAYESQQAKEYWAAEITSLGFGTGVKRGFHEIGFRHKLLGEIKLFNTHMQAFPDAYLARMEQGRELGLAVDRINNEETVVLIGGDLNAGPYYAHDTWTDDKGNTSDGWWKNAISLPLLQHYAGATDLVVAGRTAAEADDDVELGNAPTPPGNDPIYPFTASARSNDLYDRQYGHSEYRARLDHLLGDANGRMKVISSSMAFTDDIEVAPGVISELSDHYGVRTRLSIAPR